MIDQAMFPYLTAIVESTDDAILAKTLGGIITYWNPGAESLYGYSAAEIVGRHISLLVPTDFPEELSSIMRRLEQGERIRHFETVRVAKSGKRIDVSLTISPILNQLGKLIGASTIARDISDRKLGESKLFSLTERLSLATAVAGVGVWEWEVAASEIKWDATMSALYGFPQADAVPYKQWAAAVHPEDLSGREGALRRLIEQKGEGSGEFRVVLQDGTVRTLSYAERGVLDQAGNVARIIGVNVDVTAHKAAELVLQSREEQMKSLAEHDFLTGLPNRLTLNDRLRQAIELGSRNGRNVAVLFLDMDGFKHINDSLGHTVGDKLLQSISRRLLDCVRATDTVCRQGGDEFIVLLPEVSYPADPAIAARRMLEAIATVHPIDGQDLRITTCIGISVYPDDGLDAETLLKNADIAMYHAKEDGHSGFEFFHPDMNLQAVERQLLEADLRRAFENKELSLHYQPKIDLKTGAITGAEALIRWTHPTLGPISPAKFIPIAEACGLIVPIGARVLREACEQARSWIDLGLPALTMAVNVSAVRFQGEDFLEGILAVLAQTGLDPNSLELEVTESLLMKRPERTASTLHALRKKGVRIAIDDFGTGYSSLSYLHKLPLDVLKIDQSFIQKITTNPNQIGIVSAVIYMAKSLKLKVIAEGVETAEELAFLQAQDCDEAQGYYFSRPVPPEQFAKLLQTGIRL